jgi:hypothetical protein
MKNADYYSFQKESATASFSYSVESSAGLDPYFLKFILIPFYHLRLSFQRCFLPLGFLIKILYSFLSPPPCPTCIHILNLGFGILSKY